MPTDLTPLPGISKTAALIWTWIIGAATTFAVIDGHTTQMLPPKYFNDSYIIQSLLVSTAAHSGDSFRATAALYQFLGLTHFELAAAVGILSALLAANVAILTHRKNVTPEVLLYTTIFQLCAMVFAGQYTKELPVLWITTLLIACSAFSLPLMILVSLIPLTAYAYYVRPYWALVTALWLIAVTLYHLKLGKRWYVLHTGILITVLAFILLAEAFANANLLHVRAELAGPRYFSSEMESGFHPTLFTNNPFVFVLVLSIDWLRLAFPWELFALGWSPQRYAGAFVVSVFSLGFFSRFLNLGRTTKSHAALLLFYYSYALVQAIFEPDFGTAMRHRFPIWAILIALPRQTKWPQIATERSPVVQVTRRKTLCRG